MVACGSWSVKRVSMLFASAFAEATADKRYSMLDARKMESPLKDSGIGYQLSRAPAGAHLVTSTTIFNQREMRF